MNTEDIIRQRKRVIGSQMLKWGSVGMLVGGVAGSPIAFGVGGATGALFGGFAGVWQAPLNPKRLRWYK